MKKHIGILLICLMATTAVSAQMAYINSSRSLMFQSSLNGKSLSWAAETYDVFLNKWTGELAIEIPIDHLYVRELNPDFKPTGESLGKIMSIRGVVPINDVLEGGAEFMDINVEADIIFNNDIYKTDFLFTIYRQNPRGFVLQAEGRFPHTAFGIASLAEATDELVLVFSFSGE